MSKLLQNENHFCSPQKRQISNIQKKIPERSKKHGQQLKSWCYNQKPKISILSPTAITISLSKKLNKDLTIQFLIISLFTGQSRGIEQHWQINDDDLCAAGEISDCKKQIRSIQIMLPDIKNKLDVHTHGIESTCYRIAKNIYNICAAEDATCWLHKACRGY